MLTRGRDAYRKRPIQDECRAVPVRGRLLIVGLIIRHRGIIDYRRMDGDGVNGVNRK